MPAEPGPDDLSREWLQWIEPTLPESKRAQYCVNDPESVPLTSAGPQAGEEYAHYHVSPANIRRGALIDCLRGSDPAAKAISISAKDRAASVAAPVSPARPERARRLRRGRTRSR